MLKHCILFLSVSVIGLLTARAQSDNYGRCALSRTEDAGQFEHWLGTRQNTALRMAVSGVYQIPVVVHIIHHGESLGEGFNYSSERIFSQIKTLNEDFRKRAGTPGFNSHPDGADARIEFILAKVDPEMNATNGILRVDINSVHLPPVPPGTGDLITDCSLISYWNPDAYLNIWCLPMGFPPGFFLGSGRFPLSDLEGLPKQNPEGDGVVVNALNFGQGETNTDPNYNGGRTLTHEIGHFLGLLHTFGPGCGYNDYCEDTPQAGSATNGCPSAKPAACDGRPVMIENYMDGSYDECMNMFTRNQVARMRTVLENSPRRKSLLTSTVIDRVEDVTGIPGNLVHAIEVYPNPATNRFYLSTGEEIRGHDITVTAHNLLGKIVFQNTFKATEARLEIPVPEVHEKVVVLTVEVSGLSFRQLLMIK